MLEHCGITFSWGTEFGKGVPILAAKIGPGDRFWWRTDFFVTGQPDRWDWSMSYRLMITSYAHNGWPTAGNVVKTSSKTYNGYKAGPTLVYNKRGAITY